jgi:hypothetical protein
MDGRSKLDVQPQAENRHRPAIRYLWTEGIAQTYPVIYRALSQLERNQIEMRL